MRGLRTVKMATSGGGAYIMVWPPINPYDLIKSFVMATGEVIEKPQRKTSQEQNCGGGCSREENGPLSASAD